MRGCVIWLLFTSAVCMGRPTAAGDQPRWLASKVIAGREITDVGQVCNLSGQDTILSHDATAVSRTPLGSPDGRNLPLATPTEKADLVSWVQAHLGGDAVTPPFSFRYDGQASGTLVQGWDLKRTRKRLDDSRIQWTLRYSDPTTGLIVTCQATQYTDYPAVEWVLFFENCSAHNTPILQDVQVADLTFTSSRAGAFTLYHAEGSSAKLTDFRPLQTCLTATTDLASFGGRSSDGALPFFNLEFPDQRGVMLAVGWTGQWAVTFEPTGKSAIGFRTGMEETRLRLLPGEKIRTPAVLLLCWAGDDRIRGHNQLRRLLVDHYTPRSAGTPAALPVAASVHSMYSFDGGTNERNMIDFVNRVADANFPVDYLWIDAGWYATVPDNRWVFTGTWEPHAKRFPRGLAPVANHARKRRLKFLLWFEPERVMPNNWLHVHRPEWLLRPVDVPPHLAYMVHAGHHLLDLGNPEAMAWAKQRFSEMVREFRVDVYRHDCNIYPIYFWRNGEADDRRGLREIRYVTGLYDFLDTLQKEHPHLLIDNCASGGRRLDFEMARRTVALWRCDKTWGDVDFPHSAQSMTYGLSLWYPLHGLGTTSADPYHFRSGMGTCFSAAINLDDPAMVASVAAQIKQYRQIKHLFQGDFYPLTRYSTDVTTWIAWQFGCPELGEGVVQAFRRPQNGTVNRRFRLRGLNPEGMYKLTNWDSVVEIRRRGSHLMEVGLEIRIPDQPGSTVIVYRLVETDESHAS